MGTFALRFAAVLAMAHSSLGKPKEGLCKVCTSLADSFDRGIVKTRGKNSGSGNTDWEERNGIKWSTSETRLYEILETLCGGSSHACNAFKEDHEELIEEWWRRRRSEDDAGAELKRALCVEGAKVCCPPGHYGKKCKPCTGGAETPCGGHGRCDGDGTRAGKGTCKCDAGYAGKPCDKCRTGYYGNAGSCQRCAAECSGGCTGAGAETCAECAAGYARSDVGAPCGDVDECAAGTGTCEKFEFCENTPGNYTCATCHFDCHPDDGCTGPGPKGCAENSCRDGFAFDLERGCSDINECEDGSKRCETGQYCFNRPGSFTCLPCATACAPGTACADGTALGCSACREGYARPAGREAGCEDLDECADGTADCGPGFRCANTPGLFECVCDPPRVAEGGTCEEPAPGASDDAKDEL